MPPFGRSDSEWADVSAFYRQGKIQYSPLGSSPLARDRWCWGWAVVFHCLRPTLACSLALLCLTVVLLLSPWLLLPTTSFRTQRFSTILTRLWFVRCVSGTGWTSARGRPGSLEDLLGGFGWVRISHRGSEPCLCLIPRGLSVSWCASEAFGHADQLFAQK